MPFRRKSAARPVASVVVGLGNPGSRYAGTRHNLGFVVVDELAHRLGARVTSRDSDALVAQAHVGGADGDVLLVKPQTFVNLSGKAVGPLLRKHHVGVEDLWVVYDEMDLPLGKIRIRRGGGAGGHNGVRSLIQDAGGKEFVRVRLGVGRPDEDAVDHVLGRFEEDEEEQAGRLVALGADVLQLGLTEGLDVAMNRFNGKVA